jgi:exonuclease VII large subunit
MNSKTILKVSVIIAVVGIALLFFLTRNLENNVSVKDLETYLGESVTVEGQIFKLFTSKDGHVFFKIRDETGEIQVVAFRNSNIQEAYNIQKGQTIKVKGKVQEYKNDLEIIAKRIEYVSL